MTTINEARKAINDRFIAEWGSTSAFTFDNEDFDKPDFSPWVRLVVRNTDSNQETIGRIGNRKYNRQGSIIIQVFVVADIGLTEVDTLVETIRQIFEGTFFNGIYANDCVVREIGPDGKWYQVNVETFFFYEQIK